MKNDNVSPIEERQYKSPEARVVLVRARGVLCQSGNKPMRERDYGDGGFEDWHKD